MDNFRASYLLQLLGIDDRIEEIYLKDSISESNVRINTVSISFSSPEVWAGIQTLKITNLLSLSFWQLAYCSQKPLMKMLVRANDESSIPTSFQPQSIIVTSTPYLSKPHMPLETIHQTATIFIRSLPFSCTIHGPLLKILPLVRAKTSLGILAGN